MNLRSGHGSTSAGVGRGLGEGQGESGRGNENGNRESHEAPLLAPPPPPPPPPLMTHAKMMAAHRELAVPWRCWHRLLVALPVEASVAMAGTRVVPMVPRGLVPIRTSWGHTRPHSR